MARAVRSLVGASWAVATLPVRVAAQLVQSPTGDVEAGPGEEAHLPAGEGATHEAPADVVEDLLDLLDGGGEVVEDLVEGGVDLVEDTLGWHRRIWEDGEHGHAQIEVHGLRDPRAVGLRAGLSRQIRRLDGVRWAEVNALTGRVAVAFDGDGSTLSRLLDAIEGVEELHGARAARTRPAWDTDDRAEHPADIEPVYRVMALMAGDVLSLGWAVAGRAARLARVPVEYAGLVGVLDSHPWSRRQVERLLGRRATSLVLPLAGSLASGLAQGPLGMLVDLAHQTGALGEVRARRRVWQQREPELYAVHDDDPIEPPDLEPRPVPLPDGPVERVTQRLSQASLAGFAATLLATRDPRRATDAFLAGTPKTAQLGREGFASHLGRTLAYRGTIPLDGSALRRLDRVDTVVLDADVLVTERWRVEGVVRPDGRGATDAARAAADRLLDPDEPGRSVGRGGWRLRPFRELAREAEQLPRGAKTRAREIRRAGALDLALLRHGELVGVVHVAAQLDPGLEPVLESVRRCGHRLVVRQGTGHAIEPLDADRVVDAAEDLGDVVRELQAAGAGVLVVARQGHRGLAAADVGVGIIASTGRPSWGADLILGRELADVATLVDATLVAREVSQRAAKFALGGAGLATLVALTGPRLAAGSRAMAMVNGAAGASLIAGTWSAVRLAHRPRPQAPDRGRWHALDASRVLAILGGDANRGLNEREAAQRQSTAGGGSDEVSPLEPFLAELANPLNPILGVGAGLSAAVGSMTDAWLVLGLIGVNAAVGGAQRLRADRTVRRLLEGDVELVGVLRGGREVRVPEDRLVRGDVIVLRAGDAVPADARVVTVDACEVDESSLTGESLPVAKSPAACPEADVPERDCMLYEDTTIASGTVTAVVTATGEHTEVARSLALAGPPPPSGVELRLEELTRRLLPAALATAGVTAGVGLLRRWPVTDVAGTAVSLAIASVPEGLPFVATAGQLAGARRLARHNAVVRNPRTVEALGRVDVLCVDKTGTLTEGRVRLGGVSAGRELRDLASLREPERQVLAAALRASDQPVDGELEQLHDTDEALHAAARELDVRPDEGVGRWEVVTELPFEASRGVHAVLGQNGEGHRLVAKGAPEVVLEACTSHRFDGVAREIDATSRAALLEQVDELAAEGHRVLAVAERAASERTELEEDRLERLTLVGLLAFSDPVRDTAAEAVRGIAAAGVRTIMVTGDHPRTAISIARDLGLDADAVLTGSDLDALDDEELASALDATAVVARVTPAHKVRVVEALRRRGRTVAMTGDGANDAAAIRLADVGVALGRRSSPAARDAADIVVTDDRVETLIDALAEGRALWGSIREALAVLVGGNLGEIGFTSFASLFSRQAPLHPRQFLLVNLFTDLAPAVAIAVRPPADVSTETLLREGPDVSLGDALRRDVAIRGTATMAGAGLAWTAARLTGTRRRAGTVGLAALVGTQLGQTVAAGGWRRPSTLVTGVGSAAGLVGIIQTPGVSRFFGCRPLGPLGWAQATSAATLATIGSQVASRTLAPSPVRAGVG